VIVVVAIEVVYMVLVKECYLCDLFRVILSKCWGRVVDIVLWVW
jgi:hypothetical protein